MDDPFTAVAIAAAMPLIFLLDEITGSTPVQHLYYIPIVVAAIRFGLGAGLVVSALAIVLYHLGGELRYARYGEADILKTILFAAVGIVAAKLSDYNRQFRILALTDDLTGLHNLRSFEKELHHRISDARRMLTPLSLFVVDLDCLKHINDEHGHLTGAEAVRAVGHLIGDSLPPDGVACRYGGDEFAIVIPNCDLIHAMNWGDELRVKVHQFAPLLSGNQWPAGTLSISLGVSSLDPPDPLTSLPPEDEGEDLFRAADQALYRAKSAGRNRLCVWRPQQPANSRRVLE